MSNFLHWVTITCPRDKCGIQFAVTEGFYDCRRVDLASFSCPNGHPVKCREGAPPKLGVSFMDQIFGWVK